MRLRLILNTTAVIGVCLFAAGWTQAAEPIRVLLIDGQNNHNWKATSPVLKGFLERSGRFTVDVVTSPPNGQSAAAWDAFRPEFSKYQAVLSNYNGELWPAPVQRDLEAYVAGGGGLVIIHAANNAFTGWGEYNKMIGLGWRGADFGPRVTVTDSGDVISTPRGEGPGAGHGAQHEFTIVTRDREHPVMKGMPAEWLHVKDELYHGQRGPAQGMHLLATAFSDKSTGGTGAHEPMVWWIPYGKGKVFTTVMGHGDYSMKCVGFQATVNRGTEWVATGNVTVALPENFPTAAQTVSAE